MKQARHAARLLIIAAVVTLVAPTANAESVLPALPANERVISKLRSLKENEAVLLGTARVVGDFNATARKFDLHVTGPRGRDFTNKMAWAPERRRALFLGANHATPHRLNDVWEFDLAALTWAMLYAPDNSRSYGGLGEDASDVEFKDGLLVTSRGGPAVIGHTWWGLTYDPLQKRLLYMNTWVTNQAKVIERMGGDPALRYTGPPLWSFDPQSGHWRALKSATGPKAPFGGMLEYASTLEGAIWHMNNSQMRDTWLFASRTNSWRKLTGRDAAGDFAAQSPFAEAVGYFDPVRKILVAHRGKGTFHFDTTTLVWKKVHSVDTDSDRAPPGHDARTPFYYDPASGHGLLVDFVSNTLWTYDPDQFLWTRLRPGGDEIPKGRKRLAYVDHALNVLVVIEGTTVWAYRHRTK